MTRFVFLLLLFIVPSAMAASSYGLFEIGLPNTQYSAKGIALGRSGAALLDESHSLYNPAKMAFNTQTTFMVLMAFETAEYGATRENSFSVPYLGLDFPIGFMGNFGVAYFQKYSKDFHFITPVQTVSAEGSYAEIVPSWSHTFLSRFAVGVNYHIPFGSVALIKKDTVIESESVIRYGGDWQLSWAALSLQYSGKGWSLYAGYQPQHIVTRSLESEISQVLAPYDSIGVSLNQSAPITSSHAADQTIPWNISAGAAYKIGKQHQFSLDGSFYNWDGIEIENMFDHTLATTSKANNAYSVGVGYELTPSLKTFDFYLKRVSYRLGLNYSQLYVAEAQEINGSLGFGLPLGQRRASQLDVTVQMGYRGIGAVEPALDEYTMGLYVSFTGFGNWGKSSTRYR